MASGELMALYPQEGEEPSYLPGIDFAARQAALSTLRAYYVPGAVSFGAVIGNDSFRDLSDFLGRLNPDPAIDGEALQRFFSEQPTSPPDASFSSRAKSLIGWIERQKDGMPTWESCLYRHVAAVSETTIETRDEFTGSPSQKYTVGAVGSSGGHEFFGLPPEQEAELLQESLLEALIVREFPVTDAAAELELVSAIKKTTALLLEARRVHSPFAWSPNCKDLHEMANQGAETIAENFGVTLRCAAIYKTCLMHKYNPQNAPHWEAAGLPVPGNFGRLRCPSHCAEAQAILRNQLALHIPLITGVREAYLLAIGNASHGRPDGSGPMPAVELNYVVPKGGEGFEFKRLIIDSELVMAPFAPNSTYPYVSFLHGPLRQAKVEVKKYDLVGVRRDGNEVVVYGNVPVGLATETTYVTGTKELARFKWTDTPRTKVSKLSLENLLTSTLPCLHCLSTMAQYGVEHLHIGEIDWESLKGDDGLVMEWLMRSFGGKMSVEKHMRAD